MRTRTSKFGVSKRVSHDSTPFYNRKLYQSFNLKESQEEHENLISKKILDTIIHYDSKRMDTVPDSSIHLVVTSPPYNVGKEYDNNLRMKEYLHLLEKVFSEIFRVLVNV